MMILRQNELRAGQRVAAIIDFRLNLNAVVLGAVYLAMLLSISVHLHVLVAMVQQKMVLMLLRLTIHRILVARLNVLVEVGNVGDFRFANVALIDDIVAGDGRLSLLGRRRCRVLVLVVLLLVREDVLFQVGLLRVGLEANVAAVRANS